MRWPRGHCRSRGALWVRTVREGIRRAGGIVAHMRAAVTRIAAAGLSGVALLAGAAPAAARVTAAAPSPRQISRALARAEAASTLWATINICHVGRSGDLIGVRGQMPTLGFTSRMSMTLALQTWSASHRAFVTVPSPNASNHVALGPHSSGLQQGGAEFPFRAGSAGRWRASVTFSWVRAGRLLGHATRTTTAGHPGADYSSPPHYSAAACQLG
jgi:hypothetical protein